jgi:hypothetical protein
MPEDELLEWRGFVVNERPAYMWGFELAKQNEDFLLGLDPLYFTRAAESYVPLLDAEEKQTAALALRTSYAHGLETLFALLCAAIQAPHCPLGWILKYAPGDVPKVIRRVHNGESLLSRLVFDHRWQGLSERIHMFRHADPEEDGRIKHLFADVWSRLAEDFLDDLGGKEYNSIKHGLRAKASGMSFRMGRRDAPGDAPIIDSSAEFGSRFFIAESLYNDAANFYVRYAGRAWSPRALAVRLELIALSLGNIVSFLLAQIGTHTEQLRFQWPEAQSNLALAWQSPGTIRSFLGGDEIEIAKTDLRPPGEILAVYRAGPDL